MKFLCFLLLSLTGGALATLITVKFTNENGVEISTKVFRIAAGFDPTSQGLIVVILEEDDGFDLGGGKLTEGDEFVMKWANQGDHNMLRNERNAYYILNAQPDPLVLQWFPRFVGYGKKVKDPTSDETFHGHEPEVLLLEKLKCTFQEVDFVKNCTYEEVISLGLDLVTVLEILDGKKMSNNDLKFENLMFRDGTGLRPVVIDQGFAHFPNDLIYGTIGGSLLYRCLNLDKALYLKEGDSNLERVNDFETLGILLAYAGSTAKPKKSLPWLALEEIHEDPESSLNGLKKQELLTGIRQLKATFPESTLELMSPELLKVVQTLVAIGRGAEPLNFVELKQMFLDILTQLQTQGHKTPSQLEVALANFKQLPRTPLQPPPGSTTEGVSKQQPKRPPPVPSTAGRPKLPGTPTGDPNRTSTATGLDQPPVPLSHGFEKPKAGNPPKIQKEGNTTLNPRSKYKKVGHGVYVKIEDPTNK